MADAIPDMADENSTSDAGSNSDGRSGHAIDRDEVRAVVIDAGGEPVIASEVQEKYNDRTGEDRTRRGIYGHLKALADDPDEPVASKKLKRRTVAFWYDDADE